MKKSLHFILFTLLLLPVYNYAQSDFTKQVQTKLDEYHLEKSPEKVYIHTDKSIYNTGEDVWYTAYLVNGINHQQSKKSKVIYAELINPQDSIVDKKTLYVENMSVAGDFKIEENWPTGKYTIRGYTNYMRNNANSFFQKEISVFKISESTTENNTITSSSTLSNSDTNTANVTNNNPISFYPEGGYLVNGLSSKVAFELTNETDDFSGLLIDEKETIIAEIKTVERGIGVLTIIPEQGKQYFVKGTLNGTDIKTPLPKALPNGYVINVTNTRRGVIVTLNSNTPNGLKNTYIVAHQRGNLLFDSFETRDLNTNVIKVPSNTLNDGVVNFTLFDENGHPVAERVIFIDNPTNNITLSVQSDKEIYGTREKVNLDIALTNSKGLKEYSFLSMAVRNLEAFPYNKNAENIKSYLLLNSDLRGQIKNPGYFFAKENDAKRKFVLDLVMMTNGWKRFTWQELLANQDNQQTYKVEEGLYVSGTTYDYKKKDQPTEAIVRMTFMGKFMAQTPKQNTDANGKFEFGPDIYPGSITAIVEARKESFLDLSKRSKNIHIELDEKLESPVFDKSLTIAIPSKIKQQQKESFLKVNQYIQQVKYELDKKIQALEAVELAHKRATELEKRQKEMKRRSGYGTPDNFNNRIDLENLDYTPADLFQVLENNPVISFDGENFIWNRNRTPTLIFLDDRQIDVNFLYTITPDEISFLDILTGTNRNIFANTDKAIIALYSKGKKTNTTSNDEIEREPGIVNFVNEGFYLARKFYAPKHVSEFNDMNTKNLRTTLHWQPLLVTTNKENTKASFFTNDITTDYIIELEGISIYGQPIYTTKIISVE